MGRLSRSVLGFLLLCCLIVAGEAEYLKYKDPKMPVGARIKDLMKRMTLEEKIGQMVQIERTVATPDVMKQYFIGSVLSGGGSVPGPKASAEAWVNLVNGIQKASLSTRLGIPMIYGIDAVHGHNNVYNATIFPHNVGLGVTRDPQLVKKIGEATALEVRATGIPYAFAPCIAVCRDPRWGRCYESYSEDHRIVQLMTEIIPGLQGELPANSKKGVPFVAPGNTKVAACAKHFVGDGGTTKGIDENNTVISMNGLLNIHMPAYYNAISKGVATVMVSYSSWNGKRMHSNQDLVTGFLKNKMKFRGFVISDWQGIDRVTSPPHANYSSSVQSGVDAGIDMIMVPFNFTEFIDDLTYQVKNNIIPMSRINDAVQRILRVKFVMGLFEKPLADLSMAHHLGSQEHRELAREAVRKSLVLLKNGKYTTAKPLLPLPKKGGVRRAMRQQGNVPSSVISSHSMHLGVLATAWHAVSTGTLFTVYYKPRTSPAEFIVPFDQYMESVKSNYSIGMRFKMRFEGEEAPEQRFTGTIVGIEDADPGRWKNSKWRCLKVRWDETSTMPRPERVSPWKIEPALAPPALNPLPLPRPKRPRANMVPSSPDSSVLTRDGSFKVTADPPSASGFSRVLQGQEFSTLRGTFAESNESNVAEQSVMWPSSADDERIDVLSTSRRFGSERWMSSARHEPTCTDLLSGFGTNSDSSHGFGASFVDQTDVAANPMKKHLSDQGQFNLLASPWSIMSPGLLLKLSESNTKVPVQGSDVTYQARANVFSEYPVLQGHRVEQSHKNWMMHPPPSHFDNHANLRELMPKPVLMQEHDSGKSLEGNCKLFGIPLKISKPVAPEAAGTTNTMNEPLGHIQPVSHQLTFESDQKSEQSKGSKMTDENENEKPFQAGHLRTRDNHGKAQNGSTRSCTKVQKQGIALGRSVDLAKFNNYEELIAELDRLFEFNGELMSPQKNWLIVYTDDEDDMMLVGDDPWQEFVGMVRKIVIYTKEEAQKIKPGAKGAENPMDMEGEDDAKEAKRLPLPTASSPMNC